MKESELRIGNKVMAFFKDEGFKEVTINGIWKRKIMFDWPDISTFNIYTFSSELDDDEKFTTPIPITEEWLLKFGFDKCLNGFWDSTEYINVRVNPISFYLSGSDTDLANENFKYVHQLQNLYFALTETELSIR